MSRLQSDELGILAYKRIKSMIMSNELPQGKKIVQDKLALELGISRTPLRSALQMLEAENLVESVPRSGMIVKAINNTEIIEVFECRIALEGMAFRLFAESASLKSVQKLHKLFDPFIGSDEIDAQKYKSADIAFHEYVINECGNGFLQRLFLKGNLMMYIDRIGLLRSPKETLPEHINIINAIDKRDLDEVERLARLHLIVTRDIVKKRIEDEVVEANNYIQ